MACQAYFHNLCTLGIFLPAAVLGYWLMPSRRWKLAWLTGASLVFYGFWDVRFIPLLLASAVLDFLVGWGMALSERKKPWLALSVGFNLGVLAAFKYASFAAESATTFLQMIGSSVTLPGYELVLPVGISFYTFQSMSYTIDLYREEIEVTGDLLKYVAFVTLFPQLVAGPIVRYTDLAEQLDDLPNRLSSSMLATGLGLFALGLAKKALIADQLAPHVDALWAFPGMIDTGGAWLAMLGYTLQLYFDFSGYTDMAIGLGALLGLRLPENFRAPYKAVNPSDFWRRWHITLSRFLRDYLYIPLGGNRGPTIRVFSNLIIVMALGGLWHGAGVTFLVWGVYHGLALAAYHATKPWWDQAPKLIQRVTTFAIVTFGWVLFRAPNMTDALLMYQSLLPGGGTDPFSPPLLFALAVLGLLVFVQIAKPSTEREFSPDWRHASLSALLVAGSVIFLRDGAPFLYYQF